MTIGQLCRHRQWERDGHGRAPIKLYLQKHKWRVGFDPQGHSLLTPDLDSLLLPFCHNLFPFSLRVAGMCCAVQEEAARFMLRSEALESFICLHLGAPVSSTATVQ